ncbi:MAG: ATPase domain-containing protein [Candidatus Binataceae bacterium]
MAASLSGARDDFAQIEQIRHSHPANASQPLEFAGVFLGRELTRKERRLSSGLISLDTLIGGGIVRGRISEIVGPSGSGKTSLAARFIAAATRRGEAAAWIDLAGAFDPASAAASGVDLPRTLWVHPAAASSGAGRARDPERPFPFFRNQVEKKFQRAIELVLKAGGFGVVVVDFGNGARALLQSTALRIARLAERAGTAVIVLGSHRMCGTFAALSLALKCGRVSFTRIGPALFDGFAVQARVARNKLGGTGADANWLTLIDPLACAPQQGGAGRPARPATCGRDACAGDDRRRF